MAGDLRIGSEELSFIGASEYLDARPDFRETEPRIYVKFRPAGTQSSYLGLLDTGAHYCILAREIANSIEDHLTERIGKRTLRTAYGPVRGDLYTHQITLIGEVGAHLEVDAVVLILPDWQGPSFLGYVGALDRVQFAIHPRTNRFFFGPLE